MNPDDQNMKARAKALRQAQRYDEALPLYERLWRASRDEQPESAPDK